MLKKLELFLAADKNVSGISYVKQDKLLQFSIDGKNYLAEYYRDSDPMYFRIMLPIVEKIDGSLDLDLAKRMAEVSSAFKVGKALYVGKNVWLSAEVFICDEKDVNLIFARLIAVLDDMFNDYNQRKNGSKQ